VLGDVVIGNAVVQYDLGRQRRSRWPRRACERPRGSVGVGIAGGLVVGRAVIVPVAVEERVGNLALLLYFDLLVAAQRCISRR
jgi:hypothetical protein